MRVKNKPKLAKKGAESKMYHADDDDFQIGRNVIDRVLAKKVHAKAWREFFPRRPQHRVVKKGKTGFFELVHKPRSIVR